MYGNNLGQAQLQTGSGVSAASGSLRDMPEPSTPVSSKLEELRMMVSDAQGELVRLAEKLRPVLSPESTNANKPDNHPTAIATSPIESQLEDIRLTVQSIAAHANRLCDLVRC